MNKNVFGKLLSGGDLYDSWKQSPDVEWLVEGVMTTNSLNILAAASNVGKSFLVLDLIRALCSTDDLWMGTFKVRNNSKVLFIDGEDVSSNIGRRLVMLGCYDKTSTFKSSNLMYPSSCTVRLNDLDSLNSLADYCNKEAIDLVVFDSFAVFCGGDESSNSQMSVVAQNLSLFRSRCNSAVLTLNHVRKIMGNSAKNPLCLNDVRGASAIAAMVDSAFAIQRFSGYCRLRTIKGRHISMDNWLDKCYSLESNGLDETDKSYRCFFTMMEDQNADDSLLEARIVEFIDKYNGCTTRDIVQNVKGKHARVVALLKEMLEYTDGPIKMVKDGKKHLWYINEEETE